MVAGIGIGTPLGLDGTAAHAFCHVIYKALLFMSMGAVLHRTGTIKASELGGLYKSMPWTATFCIVGSASISAFPLFSGFISKSLILAAVAEQGQYVAWLFLLFASTGVLDHSGIKIPFFSFFAHDSGIRVREAPWNMLAAMAIAAFLCIALGVWPAPLYALLPYPVEFMPYTTEHVITQSQLLLFAALAFTWLMRTGLYPPELPSLNVDFDVVYRKGLPALTRAIVRTLGPIDRKLRGAALGAFARAIDQIYRHHGPGGVLARTVGLGNMVLWVMLMLAGYLLISLTDPGAGVGTG
jgi:multicomponent Na+:H+ antiporter subunit D